jgi:predicted DNA-binding transcriptional regulator YafY
MGPSTYSKMIRALACIRSKRAGATVQELMTELECSRSTVERVLTALRDAGFELTENRLSADDHRSRRWAIARDGLLTNPAASQLLSLSLDERLALEETFRSSRSPALRDALSKVLAFQNALPMGKDLDLDELISRDLRASKVGPRQRIDPKIVEMLREALVSGTCVRLSYAEGPERLVAPHGIIRSRFHYLVARGDDDVLRTFRLDLISTLKSDSALSMEPDDWTFGDWAQESFGIYHGDEPINAVLEFSSQVADRAGRLLFHPSQWAQKLDDGSLIVHLRCKGHRELLHEILHPDWLGHVKVLGPPELVNELNEFLKLTKEKNGLS